MRSSHIRRHIARKMNKEESGRSGRTYPKPGLTHYFAKTGEYLGSTRKVAPFLPSSPVVNGVRMRYEGGKLVPRV